jgi:DNA-binding CsgD family transcriptional regulator
MISFARATDRTTVEHAIRDARAGKHVALAVSGEPGIGKSDALRGIAKLAAARDFVSLVATGSRASQAVPFGLVVDAVDPRATPAAVDRLSDEQRTDVRALWPSLDGAASGTTTSDGEQRRMCHAVHALLREMARERALILALDDIHWADDATRELIDLLLRRPVPRLLLVLAYRARRLPISMASAIAAAEADHVARRIDLVPLSLDEAAAVTGLERASFALKASYHASGGNPRYLAALTQSPFRPVDAGDPGVPTIGVPDSVQDSVRRELADLAPDARLLAESAAVVGTRFDVGLAADVAEFADEHLALAALDELLEADIVRETTVPRVHRFRHPIVRQAVYDGARAGWRLLAHRRAATVLAARGADASVRALHVERSAGVGEQAAIELLAEAGRAAEARAPAAAGRWFEAAIRLLPDGAAPLRHAELLEGLAGALAAAGRLADSRAVLTQLLTMTPTGGPPAARARIAALVARVDRGLGRRDDAQAWLVQALHAMDPLSSDATILHVELATNALLDGAWQRAARAAELAVRAADRGDDLRRVLAATALQARIQAGLGEIDATRVSLQRATDCLARLTDADLRAHVTPLVHLGFAHFHLDGFAAAAAVLDRAERVCRTTGHIDELAVVTMGQAFIRLRRGQLVEAAAAADASVQAAERLGSDELAACCRATRRAIALARGVPGAALDVTEDPGEPAGIERDGFYSAIVTAVHGEALILSGHSHRGRAAILGSHGQHLERIPVPSRPYWLRVIATSLAAERACDEAEVVVRRCAEEAARTALTSGRAYALEAMGELRLRRGNEHEAARLALDAARHFDALGMYLDEGRARWLAGRAYAKAGDRRAAEAQLSRAFTALEECDATVLAERAATELRRLGKLVPRRRASQSAVDALSPREREVAELVMRGSSNRQIAERLVLSQKTVETHLRKVFDKLGVGSRTEVAVAMARTEPARELAG